MYSLTRGPKQKTVDRFGRRALLMFSATGLCVCFSLASILLSTGTQPAAYGATAMVFLFQIFLGIGWLPIPWFYPSEITTTRIRSKGQALGSFINWYVLTNPSCLPSLPLLSLIYFFCIHTD